MKHTKKKKLLAFVLCMVLVLSTAITAFAVDGNFYYVPKDTVELSHEIMKDGASQGTLYATVLGGAFRQNWRIQAIPDILFIRQLWEMFPSGSAQKIKHRFRKKQLISGLKIHPWIQHMQWDLYMTVLMRQLLYMS